ncbi:MAG: formate--tetrahydrofolate ligase [Lentisphaeria bacterium]|jgi:formate--tetrahydrofolate ligase
MQSDLEIARAATPKPILEIAAGCGLRTAEIEPYGWFKAKVDAAAVLKRLAATTAPAGKYVVVTAITPTPLGEGKTVTTIGLTQALNRLGKKAIVCIRQPSMGPVFGIKGGAAGGGWSQVVPMEDFNLHLTGDVHAVGAAHNLLAAAADSSLLLGNPLDIDEITLRRVVDINDRALRRIVTGLGGKENGVPRETGFDITVASEVMAILALAEDLHDLRRRLGKMIFGFAKDGRPLTAEDLGAAGAMAALLTQAVKPTLMQTLEGTPAFVHAGPFANIAHGNSSIIADRLARRLGDYVVTEAGFGADMGFEKFLDIKCRASGLLPDCAVVVATVRALKMHSGKFKVVAGKPLPPGLVAKNLADLDAGLCNLEAHLANIRKTGVPAVVAINRFASDHPEELERIRERALAAGAAAAEVSELWAKGGAGGEALARAVVAAAEAAAPAPKRFYYDLDQPLKAKIETLCRDLYGAARVSYAPAAEKALQRFAEWGAADLPVCMAKTHLSLSHDPALKGWPRGYEFPITDARLSAGAGFVYLLAGEMRTMPGFGSTPAYRQIDLDAAGQIQGLS